MSHALFSCLILLLPLHCLLRVMLLVAQGCEPKCTEVGVVSTDQVMHSVDEDRFANIKVLKSEKLPVKD